MPIRHFTSRKLRAIAPTARGNPRAKAARIKARLSHQDAPTAKEGNHARARR